MSDRSGQSFAGETSALERYIRGVIRRVVIKLTDGTRWQYLGHQGGAGGDEVNEAEVFGAFGIWARPPDGGKPEAILGALGGAKSTVVIAARDEVTRRKIVGDLQPGETAVFCGTFALVLTADGHLEVRRPLFPAIRLASVADLLHLRVGIQTAVIAVGSGGANAIAVAADASATSAGEGIVATAPPTPWPRGV